MKIKITEVGPRDGLQNEKLPVSIEDKFQFIQLLNQSGLKNIEITSFVRPDRVPQLADSVELSEKISPIPGTFTCLVPNAKGYESAKKAGYKEIAVFTAASESFVKRNTNVSIEESLKRFAEFIPDAKKDGIRVRIYISTVVHCPYEGKISPEIVFDLIEKVMDFSPVEISLGETIGRAVPVEIESLLKRLLKKYPPELFAGHFHDTYGTALANVSRALDLGVRSFDSSAGGLGGCPYAPGASGNLATEELVYFLESSGYDTGVSLPNLVKASSFMEGVLKKASASKVHSALKNTILDLKQQ
ncbi:MAG: hydroxymethylglutaryl-CoA lyase [Leptospiraceae bacterium]|nr:hydroxymethylglutaryl-CoA lyase [Leptospiraceae bacterium]MCP5511231.1 hydroxymethylglutaryl-CoA lyase [Leptospiraceae bacterium]